MKAIMAMITGAMLVGCAATDPNTGASKNSIISVQYGVVQQVEQVNLDPSTGRNALIGGGLGALAASGHSATSQVGAAAAGALIGALIAKETAGTGERYTVALASGASVAVVTEHHDIAAGDCVSIEQGKHVNIRRVSPVMCSTPTSHPSYSSMNQSYADESAECHRAKEKLLQATTSEATDIAYRQMRALCEA